MLKSVASLAVLLTCLGVQAFAQSQAQVSYWREAVATTAFADVARRLSDPSVPSWPVIISAYATQHLPDQSKQVPMQCLKLADAMRDKMAAQLMPKSDIDAAQVKADVELYNSLGQALDRAGGYDNLLLADSFFRLALDEISGLLLSQSESASAVETILARLSVPVVDTKTMLDRLGSQGADVQPHLAGIRQIKSGETLYKALETAGIDFDILFILSTDTSSLLKEPSVVELIRRMAQTEAIVNVNLRGTIRFFELGGTYAEVDPRDIRPFESRMGKEASTYKYPLLHIRKFQPTDLLFLIAIHNNPGIRSAWLDIVFK